MKTKKILPLTVLFFFGFTIYAQVAINTDGSPPGAGSILHVKGEDTGAPVEAMFIESSTANIGIGTVTPGFKLTFRNEIGPKISLWGQSGNHFGFGIDNYLLQIYTATSIADIALGFGSSSSFNELMRIRGNGQVAIGTSSPENSAALEINSTTKGFLLPTLTQTQMENISNPATGLHIYNTDFNTLCIFNGTSWDKMDRTSLFNRVFLCGDQLNDFRDSTIYNTVKIGTQCWMAENLNIGTLISNAGSQTGNGVIEKYCYNNAEVNCDGYGGLYQWDEMMQYITTEGTQGICPPGWHLPTDTELAALVNFFGGLAVAGGKMKEIGLLHWLPPNTGATNESGFTGLPGGFTINVFIYMEMGTRGYFWSSTQNNTNAWHYSLMFGNDDVDRSTSNKARAYSVRCIMD